MNTRLDAEADLENFLARYAADVRELVQEIRAVVLAVYPEAVEIVDPPSGIIAYGSSSKYADLVCAIAPFKDHINLMFSRGVELPDPAGLLTGTGKRARHVRISSLDDIHQPEVGDLIRFAVALP